MTEKILRHLRLEKKTPTVDYLQELITAYCKYVPWESVSKILKNALPDNPANCVRLEEEFWNSTITNGTGGTCYESNWAFFYLLQNLGFKGYLTINNIADKSSVHSAIVIKIGGRKYIADIGYPVYAAIPIMENGIATTEVNSIMYSCSAVSPNEYIIENFPHPKPYLYHLTDIPVGTEEYLKITCDDYGETGLFSDRIVIRKVVDNISTRFDSMDLPYNIHTLQGGTKQKTFIDADILISTLSSHFQIDAIIIRQAFDVLNVATLDIALR